jgi:hypothetical protein
MAKIVLWCMFLRNGQQRCCYVCIHKKKGVMAIKIAMLFGAGIYMFFTNQQ